jgi:hypothetical protein
MSISIDPTGIVVLIYERLEAVLGKFLHQRAQELDLRARMQQDIERRVVVPVYVGGVQKSDVDKIYCPLRVRSGPEERTIDCCHRLGDERFILIEGLAGQGKSTLLRLLFSTVAKTGANERSPPMPLLFLPTEVVAAGTLLKAVLQRFNAYGIHNPAALQGSETALVVLLDDVHRLPAERQHNLVHEINEVGLHFPNLRVIATGRPGTRIDHDYQFTNFTIIPISSDERKQLVRNLVRLLALNDSEDEFVAKFEEALEQSGARELWTSPLSASFALMLYVKEKKIALNIAELYHHVLEAFTRHIESSNAAVRVDAAKLAWQWIEEDAGEPMTYAWAQTELGFDAARVDEMARYGFVVSEGGQGWRTVSFSHDRIAEFLAAEHVKNHDELYKAMVHDDDWLKWSGVLSFLSHIDTQRFQDEFLRSDLSRFWTALVGTSAPRRKPGAGAGIVEAFLEKCTVDYIQEGNAQPRLANLMVRDWPELGWWARRYRWLQRPEFYKLLWTALKQQKILADSGYEADSRDCVVIHLDELAKKKLLKKLEMRKIVQAMIDDAWAEWEKVRPRRRSRVAKAGNGK